MARTMLCFTAMPGVLPSSGAAAAWGSEADLLATHSQQYARAHATVIRIASTAVDP